MNDQERIEWLKERQTGIGGSDAAAVLGVHPFMTPLELWESKVNEIVDQEPTGPMMRGVVLEPVAADLYVEKTERQIRRQPLKRHPDFDHMLGNVDRQILAVGEVESTGILEVKCPGLRVMANVKARGLSDYMTVQLMHYLAVYGYSWGSFCLFNAENWDLIWFDLEADQDFIAMLAEKESEFWTDYVVPKIAPPEDVEELWADVPKVEGELKVVDGTEWREAALELQEARTLKGAASELEKIAAEKLKVLMEAGSLDAIEIAEFARIYWRAQQGRTQWRGTAEKLAKAADLDVQDYIVTGKGSRPFKPYFLRGQEE